VQVEPAGVARGAGDGAFEVEFLGCALRAKRRRRRRATLMLRVPSSTLSSRLRYSRFSQTLTAERFSLLPPTRMPSGCVPP
jgi:hypothetical protein